MDAAKQPATKYPEVIAWRKLHFFLILLIDLTLISWKQYSKNETYITEQTTT